MYEVTVTVERGHNTSEHQQISFEILDSLKEDHNLICEPNLDSKPGTRGYEVIDIVIKAVEIGFFAGLYTIIIDVYDRFKNSEVTLNFKNGDSIVIKNLSQQEALDLIKHKLKLEEDE